MSSGDQRLPKPRPPPRKFPDAWKVKDPMKDLYPRLPRSICPNAPRVNLNAHWPELEAWYQAKKEGIADLNQDAVVETMKALKINSGDPEENNPDQKGDDGNRNADGAKKTPDSKFN